MRAKRILTLITIIAMLTSFSQVFAALTPTISIKITDASGSPVTSSLVSGDIIRVGVYMSGFAGLSLANPSIHFNPAVLEVYDVANSSPYPTGVYNPAGSQSGSFFTKGKAIDNSLDGWGGSAVMTNSRYPYLNNQTGLIRMLIDSSSRGDLIDEQAVYFVDMRVIGVGDADLRLTRMQDGLVDVNNPAAGFKPREGDWYDMAVFPGLNNLNSKPIYAIYNGDAEEIVTKSENTLTEPTSTALLTEISVDTSDASDRCFIGDTFALKIYVKNVPDMYNITIPFSYNTEIARLLDVNRGEIPDVVMKPDSSSSSNPFFDDIKAIVTVPDYLSLIQNKFYPLVDPVKGFVDILIFPAAGDKIILNDEKTLVCTLYFKTLKEGEFEYRFPAKYDVSGNPTGETVFDEAAPFGVMITETRMDVGIIGSTTTFPEYALSKLRIEKNSSKAPGEVIVYPLQPITPHTADVLVTGVKPDAIIKLYYKDDKGVLVPILDPDGKQYETKADNKGYGIFLDVPIENIKDYAVSATALEPHKEESGATEGKPDLKTVIQVIHGFKEHHPSIPVAYDTPKGNIPFPANVVAETAYYVEGYALPFLLPSSRDHTLRTSDVGWTSINYTANVAASYMFNALPHPDAMAENRLMMIDDEFLPYLPVSGYTVIPALQEVIVAPPVVGGGGGLWRPSDPVTLPPITEHSEADHYRYLQGYPDGTIQPERYMTREETATVFYRLLSTDTRNAHRTKENNFLDISEANWSITEISTLASVGIVNGDENSDFRPLDMVTRAEFAAMATRFDNLTDDATHGLTDISGHWAEMPIAASYQMGWVDGYEDGTFRPDNPITRAEAAKLINRVLKRRVDQNGLMHDLVIEWPDLPIAHWAYYEIMEATISHKSFYRYDNRVMEKWSGSSSDLDFTID